MHDPALQSLITTVRDAAAARTPLCIRGGGSRSFYGQPVQGTRLDTRALTGLVAHEPTELVVTVRAGTPLAELEAALAAHGQCLPFEPPRFAGGDLAGGTVGGMVACGLSGPARATAGAVRDYVLGLSLVNGRGEWLRFGGQVMKNVAGYDVSRLMAGALGTLGVIVDVSLKVLPVAPAEATLRFELDQAAALARLAAWGARALPLNASCWVEDAGVGTLYLRLRGAGAAVAAACRELGGERLAPAQAAADWTACRDQQLPWFTARDAGHALWRLSVPQTAPVLALPPGVAPPLVEWHGGQRWVQAPAAQGAALREAAARAGGSATLFIAPDDQRALAVPRFDALPPPLDALHRRLKAAFDPQGILNPGRLYPGL